MRDNQVLTSALIGVAVAVIIGVAAWVILGAPGSVPRGGVKLGSSGSGEPVYVTVTDGDTASSIARRLVDAGVIDSTEAFERLAKITGGDRTLAAGEYEFLPETSVLDALMRIRSGLTSSRIVTIPEGRRIEEVAEILEERGVMSANDFLAGVNSLATAGTGIDANLLSSRPRSATMEGYLYPATYSFKRNVTPQEAALQMIQALADRFDPTLRAEAEAQGLSVHEVLTLASIVEREVVVGSERPRIASVYRNRIDIDMPLQADPTVQYAVSQRPGSVQEYGYWKAPLSGQDLNFESAYNTYRRAGMPPGPIASPGIESIVAVIRPEKTNFLYFVARGDGSHVFAATFEEHQANVNRYQP